MPDGRDGLDRDRDDGPVLHFDQWAYWPGKRYTAGEGPG
jgi:hypothetical protein